MLSTHHDDQMIIWTPVANSISGKSSASRWHPVVLPPPHAALAATAASIAAGTIGCHDATGWRLSYRLPNYRRYSLKQRHVVRICLNNSPALRSSSSRRERGKPEGLPVHMVWDCGTCVQNPQRSALEGTERIAHSGAHVMQLMRVHHFHDGTDIQLDARRPSRFTGSAH